MPTVIFKTGFALFCIFLWLGSQKLLGQRENKTDGSKGEIQDLLHDLTASWNRKLHETPRLANGLLIVSSLFIDGLGIFLLLSAILGPSMRPLLGLLMIFTARQLNQAITCLPIPKGMIWRDPHFPSVFVTYGVSQDLFFSGHTALAVFGALELAHLGGPFFIVLGLFIAVFEILTVIALRAHWTMDIFAGAVTALWLGDIAGRLAPFVNARLQ